MSKSPYTPLKKIIPGVVGDLEILVNCPTNKKPIPFAAICHPHPLHGGTMNNKVVYMIANTFNALGVGTVCFNFRGVGKSVGKFDDGFGETEDLRAIVDWLKKEYSPSELWLAGFSFGGYIALGGHREMGANRLLLVAPAVARLEIGLQLNEIPTLVIMGDKDEIIAPDAVSEWAATQTHQPQLHWMAEAGHFFHGRLNELREVIVAAWSV
jgi:alpha/beta superfamily hydrolase